MNKGFIEEENNVYVIDSLGNVKSIKNTNYDLEARLVLENKIEYLENEVKKEEDLYNRLYKKNKRLNTSDVSSSLMYGICLYFLWFTSINTGVIDKFYLIDIALTAMTPAVVVYLIHERKRRKKDLNKIMESIETYKEMQSNYQKELNSYDKSLELLNEYEEDEKVTELDLDKMVNDLIVEASLNRVSNNKETPKIKRIGSK